jgi:hypothetical protein
MGDDEGSSGVAIAIVGGEFTTGGLAMEDGGGGGGGGELVERDLDPTQLLTSAALVLLIGYLPTPTRHRLPARPTRLSIHIRQPPAPPTLLPRLLLRVVVDDRTH